MHLFYSPGIKDLPILEESESHHAIKVLRLKSGDKISIMDGAGGKYEAIIDKADHKKCSVKILQATHIPPRSFYIHIAIAPTKNIDRMEWFTEKCVEFGIEEITFMDCQRSERSRINLER
ncbi:MAG TPA: RsmE family RNA methyltransferase, partial [Cytophagaceae bacterium]